MHSNRTCSTIASMLFVVLLISGLICPSMSLELPQSKSYILDEPTLIDDLPKNFTASQEFFFLGGSGLTTEGKRIVFESLFRRYGPGDGGFFNVLLGSATHLASFPLAFNFSGSVISQGHQNLTIYPDGYRVWSLETDSGRITIQTWSRGAPLWYGKGEDDMMWLNSEYAMGGYDIAVQIVGKIEWSTTIEFIGYGVYEHSWVKPWVKRTFLQGDWTWMIFNGAGFYGIVFQSIGEFGEMYIKTGRLGFVDSKKYCRFDNYTIIDDGTEKPRRIQVNGTSCSYHIDLVSGTINYILHPTRPFFLLKGYISERPVRATSVMAVVRTW